MANAKRNTPTIIPVVQKQENDQNISYVNS